MTLTPKLANTESIGLNIDKCCWPLIKRPNTILLSVRSTEPESPVSVIHVAVIWFLNKAKLPDSRKKTSKVPLILFTMPLVSSVTLPTVWTCSFNFAFAVPLGWPISAMLEVAIDLSTTLLIAQSTWFSGLDGGFIYCIGTNLARWPTTSVSNFPPSNGPGWTVLEFSGATFPLASTWLLLRK